MAAVRRIGTLTLAVAALLAAGAARAQAQQSPADRPPLIVCEGASIVRHAPDRAIISLAVESRAARPGEAQQQNAQAMTALQSTLTSLGIPAAGVQTIAYNLQQEFDYQNGKQVPRDFLAAHTIEVTVDDIDRVGAILDAAVQSGATSVRGVRFDLRDRAGVEREALRRAVADARANAEAMAAGAGGHLGPIVRLESTTTAPVLPRPVMGIAAAPRQEMAQTPVAPGELEIRGQVRLTVVLAGGGAGR